MIGRAYRLAQILSIDIVIGVVVLLRFFCAQYEVAVGWEVYVLLAAAVWLIYTADHLRDAERSQNSGRERYVFHQRHRKKLVIAFVTILVLVAPLVFFIPLIIFLGGSALAVFSLAYLLIQHRLSIFLSKELYVSIVYSLGILMVPMLLSETVEIVTLLLLFLLTYINLILFSWYEKDEDEKDGFRSIATQLKADKLEHIIIFLIAGGLAVSFLSFNSIHVFFFIGFSIYACLILSPGSFRRNHLYRTIGDGVFLLPILFEWL